MQDIPFLGTGALPQFPGRLDWLNVSTPLSLGDLGGRLVVLDFWTYG